MKKGFWLRLIFLTLLLLVFVISLAALVKEDRRGILTVAFLNIGQGDAIFIDAPNGNQILVDGGPSRSVLRELSAVMPFYDRSIDVVIASHADQDHVGGLPDVLRSYKVGLFLEPGVAGESSSYEELEQMVSDGAPQKILARAPMTIDLGGGVELRILFPNIDPTGLETNTSSIVAKLVYGESEFLLTGDSPEMIENRLVYSGADVQSDVLKAGHHGSKTSTSEAFLKAVAPTYAVISAGKDNRYGHPNKEVMDRLQAHGVITKNTATDGRVLFESDGVNIKIK